MATVGMEEIGVYISRLQIMVAQYIVDCPIMDFFLVAERDPGLRLSRRWWDQPALGILGIRSGQAASE